MSKTIRAFVLAVLVVLGACESDAPSPPHPYQGEVATDNPNFYVGKLFTHDGYTVYRFYDGGTAVYYTVPVGDAEKKIVSTTALWDTQHFEGVAGKGGHYVTDHHRVSSSSAVGSR